MRLIFAITVFISLVTHLGASYASSAPQPIQIDSGLIQGQLRQAPSGQSVIEYRGIPYAQNPTDTLRWALPKPAAPWQGIFDATHFGPACPQVTRYEITDSSLEEDCLSINVTRPSDIKHGEKLPVLFWIHGGAFVGGASNLYRLDKLASEGRMIVVSANYRLGFLGFVPIPGLAHEPVNGNFGIEDQREALRWVQRNIAAFGGDPNKVTITGESAGAASVCTHLSSPEQVKGLFQQAVIVSVGCLAPIKSVSEAIDTIGQHLVKNLGCTDSQDLKCLRSKSVSEILEAQTQFANENPTNLAIFSPAYGTPSHPNATIPTSIADALTRENGGQFSTVPILIGGMEKELLLYVGYWWQDALAGKGPALDNQTINRHWLVSFYGKNAKAVSSAYGLDKPGVGAHRFGEALSDFNPLLAINHCLYYRTADLIAENSDTAPVYFFEFADSNALVKGIGIAKPYPDFSLGPVHSSILNYWFPRYSNNKRIDAPDLAPKSQILGDQMIQYLASFIKTGKPEVKGLPQWPVYKNSQHIMRFMPERLGQFDGGAHHQCSWWKTLYPNF